MSLFVAVRGRRGGDFFLYVSCSKKYGDVLKTKKIKTNIMWTHQGFMGKNPNNERHQTSILELFLDSASYGENVGVFYDLI